MLDLPDQQKDHTFKIFGIANITAHPYFIQIIFPIYHAIRTRMMLGQTKINSRNPQEIGLSIFLL